MFALLLTMLAWIAPVNAGVVKARRSELWEKYDRLVQEYCAENWVIYDDLGDMERAVVVRDVYYGDESSVVLLAEEKKKPVWIQFISLAED